jgi:hypothetical protein
MKPAIRHISLDDPPKPAMKGLPLSIQKASRPVFYEKPMAKQPSQEWVVHNG